MMMPTPFNSVTRHLNLTPAPPHISASLHHHRLGVYNLPVSAPSFPCTFPSDSHLIQVDSCIPLMSEASPSSTPNSSPKPNSSSSPNLSTNPNPTMVQASSQTRSSRAQSPSSVDCPIARRQSSNLFSTRCCLRAGKEARGTYRTSSTISRPYACTPAPGPARAASCSDAARAAALAPET